MFAHARCGEFVPLDRHLSLLESSFRECTPVKYRKFNFKKDKKNIEQADEHQKHEATLTVNCDNPLDYSEVNRVKNA
jgi:hypothetical protein